MDLRVSHITRQVTWRLGLKFKYVTIKPENDSLGHVMHVRPNKWFRPDMDGSERIRLRAENYIVTSFAGQLAEGKFVGRRARWGMHDDNRQAVDLAVSVVGGSQDTVEAFLHFCFLRSRDLVQVNWGNIQAVAAALLKQERLTFDDVVETIMPGTLALRRSLQTGRAPSGRPKALKSAPNNWSGAGPITKKQLSRHASSLTRNAITRS